ncbi:MAG TPA: DUF2214 family protein [Gemmatimonadales bacterium]|jgi:uncharacterized membrane protein
MHSALGRWLFAAVHLLALGIGLGSVWARGRALGQPLDDAGLRRVFAAEMGLLGLILLLELGPMISLIRWRATVAHGRTPDTRAAVRFARISALQAVLVVLMVLAATAMARGYGAPASAP